MAKSICRVLEGMAKNERVFATFWIMNRFRIIIIKFEHRSKSNWIRCLHFDFYFRGIYHQYLWRKILRYLTMAGDADSMGQTHRHELLLFVCCNLEGPIVGIVIWSGTTTLSTGSISREWRRKISQTLCIHIDAKFWGWLCVSRTKSLRKRKVYCFRKFLLSNLKQRA